MKPTATALLLMALALPAFAGDTQPEVHEFTLGKGAKLQTSLSPADVVVNFFLLPLALAYNQPHGGYTRWPYETPSGYALGDREMAVEARTSRQFLPSGRQAQHAHLRVRGDNRLGWDVSVASFDKGQLAASRRGGFYGGHLTANYLRTERALLEAGFGAASFQDPEPQGGMSGELALELFPARPWTLVCRYQGASIHGRGFHDLSAHTGLAWRFIGLTAGWRSFWNPVRHAHGPEFGLALWF